MENHCAFCPGAEMPEPFLPQGTCYCCVQKNLTDSRASSLLGLGTPALGWDRIPSQVQAACFCRKENMNIQLKLCLPIAGVCVYKDEATGLLSGSWRSVPHVLYHQRQLID